MAALSSAETQPPVFNGDTAEREPGREQGLEELGPQDEEVSGVAGSAPGRGTRATSGDANVQEAPAVPWVEGDVVRGTRTTH